MSSFLILSSSFFLGASIASFLMCGRVGGRSKCDGCEKILKWYELVPVVSWLFIFVSNSSKTKCCSKILSWKYLFGETILGLWFVGCYLYFGFNSVYLLDNIYFIFSLIIGGLFFVLVMQDLDDMSVSSRYLWILCVVSILGALWPLIKGPASLGETGGFFEWEIIMPVLIFSPFWLIYFLGKYLDKPMIGEADPYVFTALGLFFGTQFSISLFLYSVWLGSFLGVGYLYFINKKFERNVRIPFLPIIFFACLIILITNFHIIKIQDILLINEVLFKN